MRVRVAIRSPKTAHIWTPHRGVPTKHLMEVLNFPLPLGEGLRVRVRIAIRRPITSHIWTPRRGVPTKCLSSIQITRCVGVVTSGFSEGETKDVAGNIHSDGSFALDGALILANPTADATLTNDLWALDNLCLAIWGLYSGFFQDDCFFR